MINTDKYTNKYSTVEVQCDAKMSVQLDDVSMEKPFMKFDFFFIILISYAARLRAGCQ